MDGRFNLFGILSPVSARTLVSRWQASSFQGRLQCLWVCNCGDVAMHIALPSPWGWFLLFCSLGIRNTSSSSRSPSSSMRSRIDLRASRHDHVRFSAALFVVPSTNDCNLAGRTFRSSSFFLLALFLLRPLPRWMPGTLRPTVRTLLVVAWASRTAQRTDRRSRSGVHPAHESPCTCLRGWFRTPALLSLGIYPKARSSTWFSSSAWSMRFPCLFTTCACLDGCSAEPGPHLGTPRVSFRTPGCATAFPSILPSNGIGWTSFRGNERSSFSSVGSNPIPQPWDDRRWQGKERGKDPTAPSSEGHVQVARERPRTCLGRRKGCPEGIGGTLGEKKPRRTRRGWTTTGVHGSETACEDEPTLHACRTGTNGSVVDDRCKRKRETLRWITWKRPRILTPTAWEGCTLFVRCANPWIHRLGRKNGCDVSSTSRRGALLPIRTRGDRVRESHQG